MLNKCTEKYDKIISLIQINQHCRKSILYSVQGIAFVEEMDINSKIQYMNNM